MTEALESLGLPKLHNSNLTPLSNYKSLSSNKKYIDLSGIHAQPVVYSKFRMQKTLWFILVTFVVDNRSISSCLESTKIVQEMREIMWCTDPCNVLFSKKNCLIPIKSNLAGLNHQCLQRQNLLLIRKTDLLSQLKLILSIISICKGISFCNPESITHFGMEMAWINSIYIKN